MSSYSLIQSPRFMNFTFITLSKHVSKSNHSGAESLGESMVAGVGVGWVIWDVGRLYTNT